MSIGITFQPTKVLSNSVNTVFIFGLLFSGFGIPIDKLLLVIFLGFTFMTHIFQIRINFIQLGILMYWLLAAFFSSIYNLTFYPMIFYPVIGLFFIFTIIKTEWLEVFHKVLFFYILICFAFGIMAYFGGPRFTVSSLATKGLPFILPFKGFTSTVQTFGSMCLLWLILNFEMGQKKFGWMFVIVLMSLILTFNRSSYVFLFIILAVYNRSFLWASIILFVICLVTFYEQITSFFFNVSTLTSREELLQGFYISYWNDNTFFGYLFGKGNNFYAPEIVRRVKWDHRPDIENGYAMLLHTYGFFGLIGYLLSAFMLLVYTFFIRKSYKLSLILIVYLFMTQFFTQEFVTNIFYLFISTILSLIHLKYENSSN